MGYLTGYQVKDPSIVFRLSVFLTFGLFAFGAVLYWKAQLFIAAEYQDLPVTHQELKIRTENQKKRESMQNKILKQYQLEE